MIRIAATALGLLSLTAQAANGTESYAEGVWLFSYYPDEDLHKMLFKNNYSSTSPIYFNCVPGSGEINLIVEAPSVDVRNYNPVISTKSGISIEEYELQFDEGYGQYFVNTVIKVDSEFIVGLISGDDLSVDGVRYGLVSPDDPRQFRELNRACGGGRKP